MPTNTYTVMEFHLDKQWPNAAGFVLGLSGAAWLFFSIADEDASLFLGVLGLLFFILSVICFRFRKIIRMDKQAGNIEKIVSTLFWKKTQCYSLTDFTGVGIGMAGGGGEHSFKVKTRTRYFVQLLGPTNLNLPGNSSNKEAIISLAEQVGGYLDLLVDKEPKTVLFQMRL